MRCMLFICQRTYHQCHTILMNTLALFVLLHVRLCQAELLALVDVEVDLVSNMRNDLGSLRLVSGDCS